MTKVSSFKDLSVWKKAVELVTQVYEVTEAFPKNEQYGITSQIRRSCISIPANIAEGWGRESTKSYLYFLRVSRGSLTELETLFLISKGLEITHESVDSTLFPKMEELGKMLNSMIGKLEGKRRKGE